MITIYIASHERHEAAEAYADKLTPEQIDQLKDEPHDWWLCLCEDGSWTLVDTDP
jgi:hypothetical protein